MSDSYTYSVHRADLNSHDGREYSLDSPTVHVVLRSDFDSLLSENEKLLKALANLKLAFAELLTYSDHTRSCLVNETGDHDDCSCGYRKAAGISN